VIFRVLVALFALVVTMPVLAEPKTKIKFYNFDDLLIDGKVRKPQVLYTDARQKVKFGRLLRLKKNLIKELEKTRKDPALR
jgi:hypothetical protein